MIRRTSSLLHMFRHGTRRALRLRPALPLYLASLALGLIQAWPVLVLANSVGADNPLISEVARGGADRYVNLFLALPGSAVVTGLWALALSAATLLYAMAYNFFAGGIIAEWGARNVLRWVACRRYFWTFTALQLIVVTLTLSALVIALVTGGSANFATVLIILFVVQFINSLSELARAVAVFDDQRNPFGAWRTAVRVGIRQPGNLLALTLAGLALHSVLVLLAMLLSAMLPPTPLNFVWQQSLLAVAILVKLLRLSWTTAMLEGAFGTATV